MATLSTQHASLLPAACQYFEHEHRYGDMEILAAITHMWRQGNTSWKYNQPAVIIRILFYLSSALL